MPTKAKQRRGPTSSKKADVAMTVGELESNVASCLLKKLGLPEWAFIEAKSEIGGQVLDKNIKLMGFSKSKILKLKWTKNEN